MPSTLQHADAPPGGAPPGPKTILVVDDNEDNRVIARLILEHVGYRVLEAETGTDGVARARADAPDLILMDVELPELNGWEATRILKADPSTRHIPIVALTAHALASDRERAVEAGCDHYLAKPVEPRTIAAEVHRLLGG